MKKSLEGRTYALQKTLTNYKINHKAALNIYKVKCAPVWEYAVEIWLNTNQRIDEVQKIQNQFLLKIYGCPPKTSSDILHTLAYLPHVEQRVKYLRMRAANRMILANTYHPLFTLRNKIVTPLLNRANPKTTRIKRLYYFQQIIQAAMSNKYWGLITDFSKSIMANSIAPPKQ